MQIFRTVADYSFGQADIIRKAMSKKQAGRIEQERTQFLFKAGEKGIDDESASELFEELVGFCKYAFNKSHAASYAVVTYRTAYLKCHYPKEYMASLLTSVIGDENKIVLYTDECKRLGIKVLSPDINESKGYFRVVGDDIRFALLALKNVGRNFVDDVVNERKKGEFVSFVDFVTRMRESDLNKRQIETLIKVGCFDYTGVFRSQLMSVYEKIIESVSENNRRNASGQLDFFSVDADKDERSDTDYKYPNINEYDTKEKLLYERECAGFFFSGNLLDNYSKHEKSIKSVPIRRIIDSFDRSDGEELTEGTGEFADRQKICLSGIIIKRTDRTTRKGDKMSFITIEDRMSQIELIVFSAALETYGYLFTLDNIIGVYGEISARGENEVKIILQKAIPLVPDNEYVEETKSPISNEVSEKKEPVLYLKLDSMESQLFKKTMNLIEIFEGNTKVVLYDASQKKYIAVNGRKVDTSGRILQFFADILGKENVIIK